MGLIPNKLRRRSMHLQAIPINEETPSSQISPSRPSFTSRNSSTFPSSPNTFTTTLEEPYWAPVRDPIIPNPPNESTSQPFSGEYSAMSYSPSSPHDYQQGYQNSYNNPQQSQRPQSYAAGPNSSANSQTAQYNNNLSRPASGQGSNRDSVNMNQNGQQGNYGTGGGSYDQQQQRRYAGGNGMQSTQAIPQQRQQYQQQPPPSQQNSSHNSSPTTSTPSYPTSSAQPSSSSTARPTSMLPSATSQRSIPSQQTPLGSATAPPTIAGEPLHDMERAISLLKSSKFYAEGFLMKKVEVGPDGKTPSHPSDTVWAKWFVQLSGTIMSTWNAAEMEDAAKNNTTVPPQYLNLQDAFLHPFPPHPRGPKPPTQYQFALNSAGMNRILFCAPSLQSLTMWINAIRLSIWERSRCNEIYTGTLIGLREPKPLGWQGYDAGLSTAPGGNVKTSTGAPRFEGYLKARLPGDTEWRRVFVTILRGANVPSRALALGGSSASVQEEKKSRRSSLLPSFGKKKKEDENIVIEELPGDGQVSTIGFFAAGPGDSRPGKKDQPICVAQHVFYASALFPETAALINLSTLFKIEGTFLTPQDGYRTGWGVGGRSEKQGFALLMLESGEADDMLRWIVGIADAFKLYGRPKNFSFDPRDPSSLYFALPIGPHRDRQFLDRELVDTLEINESRPRAIRATFHNILFDRMRGVRPAALGPAPSSAPPTIPESAPISPMASNNDVDTPRSPSENDRRRSQQPSPRNETPRLPPVLSTIGETETPLFPQERDGLSYGEQESRRPSAAGDDYEDEPNHRNEQYYAAAPSPAVAPHQPRELVAQPPVEPQPPIQSQPPQVQTTQDRFAQEEPRRHSTVDHSVSSDFANDYTAYLDSDMARQRTPPPPVPHVPSATSPRRNGPQLDRIITEHPSAHSPNFVSSPQQASALQSASAYSQDQSDGNHLNYADARPARHDWEQPGGNNSQYAGVVPPSATESRLTSPGAPTSAGTPMVATDFATQSPHATSTSTVPQPSISTREQSAPLSPTSPISAVPRESDHVAQPHREQVYNERRVDSPENLPHEETREGTNFNTQPLFASNGGPSNHRDVQHSDPEPIEALAPASLQPSSQNGVVNQREMNGQHSNLRQNSSPEDNIHSDLMAALNFVDRSQSPPPIEPPSPSTVEASPMVDTSKPFEVGPPSRRNFVADTADDRYGAIHAPPPVPNVSSLPDEPSRSVNSSQQQQQFPSSFAQNKRSQERTAAAQLAQQAQQQALSRPGRSTAASTKPKKKKVWQDSDEEEEEEEEEEDSSDDERPTSVPSRPQSQPQVAPTSQSYSSLHPPPNPIAMPTPQQGGYARSGHSPSRSPARSPNRQAYLESGPGSHHTSFPPNSAASRDNLASEAAPPPPSDPNRKPALNPHGLLATGMIEREERSARALENVARDSGGTLVSLPTKPPPPQTGLVGAITSHEREKERTGGVGKHLTEQQRERKLAEQRQKQLDELQKRQLEEQQRQMAMYQQQQQMQMAQFGGGGYNPMQMGTMGSMGSMGSMNFGGNPWMMGGGMGGMGGMGAMSGMGGFGQFPSMGSFAGSQMGMPGQTSPGLQPQNTGGSMDQFQQQQQQQQAMMAAQQAAAAAAQQAYLAAMSQFSPQHAGSTMGHHQQHPSMSMMGGQFGNGYPVSSMPASPSFAAPSFAFGGGHAQHPSMSSYGGGVGGGMGGPGFSQSPANQSPAPTSKNNSDAEGAHSRGNSST